MSTVARVLIVDDSAFARKVVREMLSRHPAIEVVGAARDGLEALELAEQLQPDVVTCDLRMPRLDGLGFVQRQMQRRPMPILIISSAAQDADDVMQALNAGAIDVIQKPTALATDDLRTIGDELVAKVRAAAGIVAEHLPVRATSRPAPPATLVTAARRTADIVVIGISTGGPQALRQMMPLFPADFPVPIAIVLHMPVGYTSLYAEKLNELCKLRVKEAAQGDLVEAGMALIAPAGRHLRFRRDEAGTVVVHLSLHPLTAIHRPSADVLFESAVEIYGERVLAVVMTGMGDDGKEGAAWVKAKGGTVVSEAEKSCVIYGMPRSVVEAGLSDAVVSLDDMAQAIGDRI